MSSADEEEEDMEYYYSSGGGSDDDQYQFLNYEGVTSESKSTTEFRVITAQEIREDQQRLIEDIASCLAMPVSSAGVLLRYFRWNKEKLYEVYYGDPDGVKKSAGVQFLGDSAGEASDTIECAICQDESNETYALGCEHRFCRDCWSMYLSVKVTDGAQCIFTTCPLHTCDEVVNEDVFRAILGVSGAQRTGGSGASCSPHVAGSSGSSESKADAPAGLGMGTPLQKYEQYLLQSYVDINKGMKWCPGKECGRAISASGAVFAVKCPCGSSFCFKCAEEAHSPVLCADLANWMEKCRNESETANWILANTKKCPQCLTRIEKNSGCNHMTCRRCKYNFCWICMGNWDEHGPTTGGYYKCNKFDSSAPPASKEDSSAAKAKAELDRYLHYYKRFANHDQSLKFAERQMADTTKRMQDLQDTAKSAWIDVQFLKDAAATLIECRRVLKFTYPFAYYLPHGPEKTLFEYLQCDLERNTEHLTELSEQPFEKMDRTEVINYTRVTNMFLANLLQGVEDGLTSEHGLVQ